MKREELITIENSVIEKLQEFFVALEQEYKNLKSMSSTYGELKNNIKLIYGGISFRDITFCSAEARTLIYAKLTEFLDADIGKSSIDIKEELDKEACC